MPGSLGWGARAAADRDHGPVRLVGRRRRSPRFGVADTHWDGGSAALRERSAALLLSWLDPALPWIVLGDFNATPAERSVRLLIEGGLRDTLARLPVSGPAPARIIASTAPPTAPA